MDGGALSRVATHVRSNVIGYLALFVALSGVAYAAAGGIGKSDLSPALKNQLGLTVSPPKNGTYIGFGTSDQSGVQVKVTTTWKNGVPKSGVTTSSDPDCVSAHADTFQRQGPNEWAVYRKTPSIILTPFVSLIEYLNAKQVYLSSAVIQNAGGGAQCRITGVVLNPGS